MPPEIETTKATWEYVHQRLEALVKRYALVEEEIGECEADFVDAWINGVDTSEIVAKRATLTSESLLLEKAEIVLRGKARKLSLLEAGYDVLTERDV